MICGQQTHITHPDDELEQLRQRVKELEYEEFKSSDMAHKNLQLWMEVSEKLGESEQRVAELEAENKDVQHVSQLHYDQNLSLRQQLAASQLDNLRLRSALEKVMLPMPHKDETKVSICKAVSAIAEEALSTPTDTEALEQYLADRLGEPVAWGNFKDNGEACMLSISQHPEDRANWMNPKPLYALKERP